MLLAAIIDSGADLNAMSTKTNSRYTALFQAVVNRRHEHARTLLEAGADVNKGDQFGTTPLFAAAQDGAAELVELLLEFGADPHIATNEGWYPLNVATSECIEVQEGTKTCLHDPSGTTPPRQLGCRTCASHCIWPMELTHRRG